MRRTALLLSLLLPLCLDAQSPASANLEGNVVDAATNAPLGKVRVRIERSEPIYAQADPQGHFVFAGLEPGRYQLTAESPGYARSSVQVDLTGPARRDSMIKAVPRSNLGGVRFSRQIADDGTIQGAVTVPLAADTVITGKVTDPYGLPAAGSSVEILANPTSRAGIPAGSEASQPVVRYSIRTDDLGQYRVSGIQPGTYWIAASPGQQGIAQTHDSSQRLTYYPAATSLDGARPMNLAAGQVLHADLQIVSAAGVKVSGRIVRPPGVPDAVADLPGVGLRSVVLTQVVLTPTGGRLVENMGHYAGGTDHFEIADVLPGKYTLMAVMRNTSQDPAPDQNVAAGLVKDVEIGPQDMTGLDVILEPVHDLPGEVTFGEGCQPGPLSIRTVGLNLVTFGQGKATSGTDGKFVMTGLAVGRYQIMASWIGRPGPQVMLSSARLGDRDVLANGFDAPYSGSEPLRITIDCGGNRRRQ